MGQAVARRRRVIHISSHSFTPELDGKVRRADVGLLYHPGRQGEALLCARWKAALSAVAPELRVRRNYPYAGKGDGLTSHLRRRFPPGAYVGVELEINQSIVVKAGRRWTALRAPVDRFVARGANRRLMMQIRVGFEMIYDCPQPTPMIFNVNVHFTRVSDLVGRDDLAVTRRSRWQPIATASATGAPASLRRRAARASPPTRSSTTAAPPT